jgi:hypothetical protein
MKILTRTKTEKSWKLVESAAYEAESELQKLLADSPDLISIQDVRPGVSTLTVAIREFPLPIGSVDLLAFSAEGDMAIIECKLATNSEIKRKVIGQALEYGANMWKMTYDELDSIVKSRVNKTLADLMHESIQEEGWDEEVFRTNVGTALEAGSFILMIVVDEITEELSRIINFMNACGNPAFSFAALEMRRFQSDGNEMLVPRIVGDNRSFATKSPRSGRKRWTEPMFFADAKVRLTPESVAIIRELYEWSLKMGRVGFGTGSGSGSFSLYVERKGSIGSVFSIYTNGTFAINIGFMAKIYTPLEVASFRESLASIPTLNGIDTTSAFYYNIPIEDAFSKPEYFRKFQGIVSVLPK